MSSSTPRITTGILGKLANLATDIGAWNFHLLPEIYGEVWLSKIVPRCSMYGLSNLSTYIWLISSVQYGKCRQIYHTWILWDRINSPWVGPICRATPEWNSTFYASILSGGVSSNLWVTSGFKLHVYSFLGGGFKYFFVHPYLTKWSNLTNIFQMGWNHYLGSCWSIQA